MAKDYGYIISPSLKWYDYKKGEIIKESFTFTNSFLTGEPEEQTFVVTPAFVFQEKGEKLIYSVAPQGLSQYDSTTWIQLHVTEFTLKQNESVTIPYTIRVPENPSPGGKYSAIVITKKASVERLSTNGAGLKDKIAYQMLGTISGTEKRNSEILDFTVNKNIFWHWPNEGATFTITLKNSGNTTFLPSGDVFVHQGAITKSPWTSPFNKDELVILPENTRSYEVEWKATGPLLKNTASGLTINLDYFRVGRYHATAKVGFDQQGKRVVADRMVTFWILPIPLIVAILTVILVILGVTLWRKRRKRK
jgi:hypothetical protein